MAPAIIALVKKNAAEQTNLCQYVDPLAGDFPNFTTPVPGEGPPIYITAMPLTGTRERLNAQMPRAAR